MTYNEFERLLHKCNDKVKGDVRKALECVNNNIRKP